MIEEEAMKSRTNQEDCLFNGIWLKKYLFIDRGMYSSFLQLSGFSYYEISMLIINSVVFHGRLFLTIVKQNGNAMLDFIPQKYQNVVRYIFQNVDFNHIM